MADYNLGTARGRVEVDASGVGKGLRDANSQLDQFQGNTEKTNQNMRKAGTVMVGAAAGIAAGFGLAINAAASFEERLSAIQAVSGATQDEMDAVSKKALQLGADTKFSASEAASAMEELIKAGLSVPDVMNGAADATVNLAAAGEVDLVQAATLAANAMNAFGLSAEEMPKVADLIAGAANASAIDVGEFGQSLSQVGAVANLVGLSFDDTAVAIAALGNAGIKGSDAGTSLKTMLSNLQPVTEKQIGLFKDLGIITADGTNRFYDANGSIKSMAEISGVLGEALAGMTDQQKTLALETMFGSDAIRAAAIIADTGAQGFEDLAASMGKVSAQEVAETRMNNLKGSLEQLSGSVETLMILIGIPLAKALRGWVDRITDVINWISSLDESTLSTVTTIAKVVGALLGAGGAVLIFVSYISKIKASLTALRAMMATNPLTLWLVAIVAVAAALYTLYQNNETFRNAVQKAFGWVRDNVVPIINTVIGVVKQLFNILAFRDFTGGPFQEDSPFINNVFRFRDGAVELGQKILGVLVPAIQSLVSWFTNSLIPAIQSAATFFVEEVVPVLISVGNWLIWLGEEIVQRVIAGFFWMRENVWPVLVALGELFVAIGQQIMNVVGDLLPYVGPILGFLAGLFQAAFAVIMGLVTVFVTVARELWNRFGSDLVDRIMIAWNLIKSLVEAALKIIQGIIQVVTGIISGDWGKAWEGVKNIFTGIWDAIKAYITAAIDNVKNIISIGVHAAQMLWDAAWKAVSDVLRSIWEQMKGVVTGGIEIVVNLMGGLPGKIIGVLVNLGQMIWQLFWDALGRAKQAVTDGVSNLVNLVKTIPGKIVDALGNIGNLLFEAGKRVIGGFVDGIKSAVGGAVGAVQGAAGKVTGAISRFVPGSPVKEGPLTVLNDGYAGKQIVRMIVGGIDEEAGSLRSSLGGLIDTLTPTAGFVSDLGGPRSPLPSAESARSGPSYSIGQVIIPAKDLEEMRTVKDFFDRIEQTSRQGVGAGV